MRTTFANPFTLDDLLVFDQRSLGRILHSCLREMTLEQLAQALRDAPSQFLERISTNLSPPQRSLFKQFQQRAVSQDEIARARQRLLDLLFWELTYWKTPELYEELTAGERLHPGIFPQLEPLLRDNIVLDVGAGSGRASFECARFGARLVYALEPSPGLLRLLKQKQVASPVGKHILPGAGDFTHLPLANESIDLALACSVFTSRPEQGGEPGLAELRRVVRPGGRLVIIWPRPEDRGWLVERGFHYVSLPDGQKMSVSFSSFASALRCVRHFYAHNQTALNYLLTTQKSEVPFSVLGFNAPCDYCWQEVG